MSARPTDVLLRARRNEAQILCEVLEGWQESPDLNVLAGEVGDLVVLVRALPEGMGRVCDRSWIHLLEGRLTNFTGRGQELLVLYDGLLSGLDALQACLHELETKGQHVDGAEEVSTIRLELQQQRDQLEDRWPWFDQASAAEGLELLHRGELADLDEAFAEAVGVDRATWQQRVEARRKQLQP